MEKNLRAFIAVELPGQVVEWVGALQDQLRARGLKLRWVQPQQIHLTIRFLGDITAADGDNAATALRQAAAGHGVLALHLQGMGVFPDMRRPRVLWIGVGGAVEQLRQLQARLEDLLAEAGFVQEKRPFRAHLTIARIKERIDAQRVVQAIDTVGQYAPRAFEARKITLFQSLLRPQGPTYIPLAAVALH